MATPHRRLVRRTELQQKQISEHLGTCVDWRDIEELKPFPNNPRTHPETQINALMRSISHGWTTPILVDENSTILCGNGRWKAARRLGLRSVPTLTLSGLTDAKKRAIVISDNKLPEGAVWDIPTLQAHFKNLIDIDYDLELTGFSTGEIDILLDGPDRSITNDLADDIGSDFLQGPAVSQPGDIWELGRHRILCGDALKLESYQLLLGRERAQMVVTDPPFNVRIQGHAGGRGRIRHREFVMASGEMNESEFVAFLEAAIGRAIAFSENGSIHYWFIDWRHNYDLQRAARCQYSELKNILVWNKTNAGQGSLYRSKHELIAVYKSGSAPHVNNVQLGAKGRYRTNVLDYPGGMNPGAKRQNELEMHPTVKPVALIADLIRDCSRRNGVVLDPFGGSGTLALAAERTGRVARVIEIDPIYVDVAVGRWERITGQTARHAETDETFAEMRNERSLKATAEAAVTSVKSRKNRQARR